MYLCTALMYFRKYVDQLNKLDITYYSLIFLGCLM